LSISHLKPAAPLWVLRALHPICFRPSR
jgi:hypothetical protein